MLCRTVTFSPIFSIFRCRPLASSLGFFGTFPSRLRLLVMTTSSSSCVPALTVVIVSFFWRSRRRPWRESRKRAQLNEKRRGLITQRDRHTRREFIGDEAKRPQIDQNRIITNSNWCRASEKSHRSSTQAVHDCPKSVISGSFSFLTQFLSIYFVVVYVRGWHKPVVEW